MSGRFIMAGLRFYPSAFLIGLVLMLVAPLDVVRILCAVAMACAAAGFGLHWYALRAADPAARDDVQKRLGATMHHWREIGARAFAADNASGNPRPGAKRRQPWAETVWPGALH